jgi:hypothetical protein
MNAVLLRELLHLLRTGFVLLCRFSAAGDDDLTTRCGDRRLKSAKARNVQVFSRRRRRSDHTLRRPAAEKRQGTKSRREIVGLRCSRRAVRQKGYGDLSTPALLRR